MRGLGRLTLGRQNQRVFHPIHELKGASPDDGNAPVTHVLSRADVRLRCWSGDVQAREEFRNPERLAFNHRHAAEQNTMHGRVDEIGIRTRQCNPPVSWPHQLTRVHVRPERMDGVSEVVEHGGSQNTACSAECLVQSHTDECALRLPQERGEIGTGGEIHAKQVCGRPLIAPSPIMIPPSPAPSAGEIRNNGVNAEACSEIWDFS